MKDFTNIERLRENWKKQTGDQLKVQLTLKEIEAITRKKSQHEMNRLKRKFLIENLISLPILIFLIVDINMNSEFNFAIKFNIYMLILLGIFIVPTLNILKIGKLSRQTTSSFLNKAAPLLKRVYKQVTFISYRILPLYVTLFAFISMLSYTEEKQYDSSIGIIIVICIITFLLTYGIFFIVINLLYKPLYLKHIKNLEQLKNDINKAEEHVDIIED